MFIFDLDGVVWAGDEEVPGAAQAIAQFRAAGKQVAFLSNNSGRHPTKVKEKLEGLGVPCPLDALMTSALAAARLVKQQGLDGGRGAFVMGTDDLRRLVEEHGTPVVPAEVCGAVVVGYDPNFTMSGVVPPMRAVLRGARFVACNREANYPGPGGLLLPGCGAAVGALEGATLKPVDTEVGKPNPLMLDLLLETLGRSRDDCVYFGDTLDSDMAMARRAGVPSVWLNGNGQPRRSNAGEHERPDVVAPDLASLAARWAGV